MFLCFSVGPGFSAAESALTPSFHPQLFEERSCARCQLGVLVAAVKAGRAFMPLVDSRLALLEFLDEHDIAGLNSLAEG